MSGIFSNADLIANYEGFLFYRGLFDDGVEQIADPTGTRDNRHPPASAFLAENCPKRWLGSCPSSKSRSAPVSHDLVRDRASRAERSSRQ